MTEPRVSVVMPVLNGERFLALAIESILRQTFRDFEFLIVNDGSTDRSVEIIRHYASLDPRVILLEHDRRGIAEALNAGCRAARGTYIARMDCDDVARADRFARQVAYLDTHEDVAVAAGAAQLIDADGLPLSELRYGPENTSLREKLSTGCWVIHPTVMMRAAALEDVGGYRQACFPAEDFDLWSRLADSHVVVNLAGPPLIDFRTHGGQVSNTQRRRQVVACMAVERAALIRRQTGHDPLATIGKVDETTVQAMGITVADIEKRYIRIVGQGAIDTIPNARPEAVEKARATLRNLENEALSPAGRLLAVQEAENFELTVQLGAIRSLVAKRRYCAAAIRGLAAAIRRPMILARGIASLLRRSRL